MIRHLRVRRRNPTVMFSEKKIHSWALREPTCMYLQQTMSLSWPKSSLTKLCNHEISPMGTEDVIASSTASEFEHPKKTYSHEDPCWHPLEITHDLMYSYTCRWNVCMYVCMYVCVSMYVCMYVCMHACKYVCMYVWMYVCMYECMYACMHVCMYAWMYVCMHVCAKFCMHDMKLIYIYIQAETKTKATYTEICWVYIKTYLIYI